MNPYILDSTVLVEDTKFHIYNPKDMCWDGIVSDITFYGDSTTPYIRQMYLHDKKTDPVEVIRYATLKDA